MLGNRGRKSWNRRWSVAVWSTRKVPTKLDSCSPGDALLCPGGKVLCSEGNYLRLGWRERGYYVHVTYDFAVIPAVVVNRDRDRMSGRKERKWLRLRDI